MRVWTYDKGTWCARSDGWPWWARWKPTMGEDEYGYRTLVLPIPFAGQLVVALWFCGCSLAGDLGDL